MAPTLPTKLSAVLNGIYLACVALFTVAIAYIHIELITHQYPLDYNEGGMLVTTQTILEGSNPYSLESQPARTSLYPVFYNILVAPVASVLGNTFVLHRAISGLLILACCALCFYLCRRESVARSESFVAAGLLYAALLYYSTPVASPNALGLLLFLAAIVIPWTQGFSTRSLCATIVLGILAFYTKQYFVACLGYVALYVFLAVSKKRAIIFGLSALSAFLAVLALVSYTAPYYFDDTFFAVQSSAKIAAADEQVVKQLKEFVRIYYPLLIILAIAVIAKVMILTGANPASISSAPRERLVNLFDFGKPLLQRKPNYLWVCCACSLIIFVLVLGKNRGNHMTYIFQLVSPFLLVGVFALSATMLKWRWPFRALIVVALYKSYAMLPTDFSVEEDSWVKIREEISQAQDIYTSTLFLKEVIDQGSPIYLSGGTRYFYFGIVKPDFLADSAAEQAITKPWLEYVAMIQSKLINREFDLVLRDQWMPFPTAKPAITLTQVAKKDTLRLLQTHYIKTDRYIVPLADRPGGGRFSVQVWKPKPDSPDAEG